MAYYVELILLASGIIGITLGYRRNDRKTMLAAACLLYVSATAGEPLVDFAHGLHEVLGKEADGRWMLRALNDHARPVVYAEPNEVVGFELPIFHCYASRNRSLIVMLVNGDEYDVTREDCPEVEGPLFQQSHPDGLIALVELAVSAGFSLVELTNGYHAWVGTPDDLIGQCRPFSKA